MQDLSHQWPKSGRVQLNGYFQSDDELVAGTREFVGDYESIVKEDKQKRNIWVENLRSIGIMAAHEDDGWHTRQKHYFELGYPHFNDGLKVGDMVALGDYKKFVVVIIDKIEGIFTKRYYYKSTIH